MQGERKRHMGVLRIAAALWLVVEVASAQEGGDVAAAARAFQEGQKAQLSGDFARAADLFELADELAPTREAVRSAIRNHDAAGHPARAATLAIIAKDRYADDGATLAMADEVLARLAPSLARLTVRCDTPCVLLIDGEALTLEPIASADAYVPPGERMIEARFATEERATETLELHPDEARELELRAPAPAELEAQPLPVEAPELAAPPEPPPLQVALRPAPRPAASDGGGLPPWLFLTAAALTVTGGAAALVSGLDALDKRDAYRADPTRSSYERGVDAEDRTNALLIATAGLAATSAVLLAFTDWSGGQAAPERASATLALSPWAPNLVLRSSLP